MSAEVVSAEVAALWIDFGGVLTSPIQQALDGLVAAAGVPVEALLAAIDEVAAETGMRQLEPIERGIVSQAEWGRRVTERLAPTWCPRVDLSDFGTHWYAGRTANTALLAFLAELKDRGLRIAMLTNSVREWEPLRRDLIPDTGLFEVVVNSHETGLRKPDPEIFLFAEDSLGVAPSACVLVDDTRANCDAAVSRGWASVHHTSTPETIAALRRLVA